VQGQVQKERRGGGGGGSGSGFCVVGAQHLIKLVPVCVRVVAAVPAVWTAASAPRAGQLRVPVVDGGLRAGVDPLREVVFTATKVPK
jgi:hypothetical protein